LFGGGLIDDASLDEMTDLPSGDSSYADSPYALGIFHDGSLWGHDGGIWGYLSAVLHDVETGVTVAVLVNRSSAPDPWPLAERLAASAGGMITS
jgi:hypothetical protein